MRIEVDKDVCTGCETCVDSCPYTAIEMQDDKAFINEYCQVCRICLSSCPEGAIKEVGESMQVKQDDFSDHKGVWVFAEQREGKVAQVAFELLGVGRKLAEKRDCSLSAVLLGADRGEAEELIKWGADSVYLAQSDSLKQFNDEPYASLFCSLIKKHKPEIVLAGATPIGRSFIPRAAARLSTGLTADCTSLDIDDETGNLLQVRPAFGGNIMATILCPNRRPQIATVRPRVMKKGDYDEGRKGEIIEVDSGLMASALRSLIRAGRVPSGSDGSTRVYRLIRTGS